MLLDRNDAPSHSAQRPFWGCVPELTRSQLLTSAAEVPFSIWRRRQNHHHGWSASHLSAIADVYGATRLKSASQARQRSRALTRAAAEARRAPKRSPNFSAEKSPTFLYSDANMSVQSPRAALTKQFPAPVQKIDPAERWRRLLMWPSVIPLLLWMIVPLAFTIYFSLVRYSLLNPSNSAPLEFNLFG
jgi:hypothetical protein